jgi:hypothetical protein
MLVRQAAQPGHFAHREAAAPFDRFTHGQARVVSHRQRRAGTQLRVPDCSVAFTERSQHLYRQRLEPAAPIGTLYAQYRVGISTPTGVLVWV